MNKPRILLASAAFMLIAGSAAHGQTLYGTNFDGPATTAPYNDTGTYVPDIMDLVGQNGWFGNDDPSVQTSPTTYKGGLNSVVNPDGIGAAGNNGGQLQGQVSFTSLGPPPVTSTVYPGQASVYVAHGFALPGSANYTFDTDFAITTSSNTFASGYGFGFLNSSSANVLSVDFVQNPNNTLQDLVEYKVGTGTLQTIPSGMTLAAIDLNQQEHLNISVNVSAGTFSITIGGNPLLSNASLAGADPTTSSEIAAEQFVTGSQTPDGNGDYTNSGADSLTFDNFIVAVPEPSTYAMIGLGVVAMVGIMRFRRAA